MTSREAQKLLAERLGELLGARVASGVDERGASLRLALSGLLILVELLCEDQPRPMPTHHAEELPADAVLVVSTNCRDLAERGDARFRAKVLAPEGLGNLLHTRPGLPGSADGWFVDLDLRGVAKLIEETSLYLRREPWLPSLARDVERAVWEFVKEVAKSDPEGSALLGIRRALGLPPSETTEPELVYAQAGLVLLLASALCERAKRDGLLEPEASLDRLEDLRKALRSLGEVNPLAETAAKLLEAIPGSAIEQLKRLLSLGAEISRSTYLARRDLAGRVYSRVFGDLATRKGLATYFTEVPASYLLAHLAVLELGLAEGGGEALERARRLRIGDLACGSGSLVLASYTSLLRVLAAAAPPGDGLVEVARGIAESGLYCVDAVDLTSRIAAANIALASPGRLPKVESRTLPLGGRNALLGSLELVRDGAEALARLPESFDLVIMNPPFTRATGRGRRTWRGERRFLGFVGDEELRARLVAKLREVRELVRRSLVSLALESRHELPEDIARILEGRRGELRQYLSIGQAGFGLLFLYLAYKLTRPGGVVAFVLPRNLLSGVSWLLARILLATKFHVRYLIVSSDSRRGYNFSEGADMSEVLLVARRVDEHSNDEETVFVNLLKKPSTVAEALALAEAVHGGCYQELALDATVRVVKRRELLRRIDNWNRFVSCPSPRLVDATLELIDEGLIRLGKELVRVPMAKLGDLVESIGINSPQFHENFSVAEEETRYPAVLGGGEAVRAGLVVEPNAYLKPRGRVGERLFERYSGRLLLPDRIWWDTAHSIAILSTRPVISNVFYSARLKGRDDVPVEIAEKALALWLNTSWGVLTVLVNRQETRGRWTRLKVGQWRLLPVLDVLSLGRETLWRLALAFDRAAEVAKRGGLRRLPDQFNPASPSPARLEVDLGFLAALGPSLDQRESRKELESLYAEIWRSLRIWIGHDFTGSGA